jgi:hypothetical protein
MPANAARDKGGRTGYNRKALILKEAALFPNNV